jgi:hypothetical protein
VWQPQTVGGLCLDLTKEKIEISEESAPVDAEGNVSLTRRKRAQADGTEAASAIARKSWRGKSGSRKARRCF